MQVHINERSRILFNCLLANPFYSQCSTTVTYNTIPIQALQMMRMAIVHTLRSWC